MKTVGKEIIDGLNRGSKSAFAALYDSYFSYLCACAATYVPDPVSAEELVNDVFVNIWEHRGRYRVPLHGYLVNSVRNACISHIRSQLFRRRLREGYERELLLFAEQRCLTDAHPLEVLSAQEVETRIRAVVETLPERCRAVFEQYFYRGESAWRVVLSSLYCSSPYETSESLTVSGTAVRIIEITLGSYDKVQWLDITGCPAIQSVTLNSYYLKTLYVTAGQKSAIDAQRIVINDQNYPTSQLEIKVR